MYNYPGTTTAIPTAQPPVATFVGLQNGSGLTTFEENPPSLVGLDSTLQENGLGMAITRTLAKINLLHRSLWRGLYKNFRILHVGIIIIYIFSMILFMTLVSTMNFYYYYYFMGPGIFTPCFIIALLVLRQRLVTQNHNLYTQRIQILQEFNTRYQSRGLYLEWQDAYATPVVVVSNGRVAQRYRPALAGYMAIHLKVNPSIRGQPQPQMNHQMFYQPANPQASYSGFQAPPPTYDHATAPTPAQKY